MFERGKIKQYFVKINGKFIFIYYIILLVLANRKIYFL